MKTSDTPIEKTFKFDVSKYADEFVEWFIISAMSNKKDSDFNRIRELKNSDGTYNITMQVNGIDVPAELAIKRMEEQFDRCVAKEANEKVQEIINEKCIAFNDIMRGIEKQLKEQVAQKLGIKTDEE